MPELYVWFLMLHILGAILAFGPSFAFPILGAMGGREPQHANFATRASYAIEEKLVVPLAFTMPITGIGLIWSRGIDMANSRWLLIGIVLYVFALAFALFVQAPAVRRLIELTTAPVAGASAEAAILDVALATAGGPPPGLSQAVQKVQRGGQLLAVLIVVIVFLMVVKPIN